MCHENWFKLNKNMASSGISMSGYKNKVSGKKQCPCYGVIENPNVKWMQVKNKGHVYMCLGFKQNKERASVCLCFKPGISEVLVFYNQKNYKNKYIRQD